MGADKNMTRNSDVDRKDGNSQNWKESRNVLGALCEQHSLRERKKPTEKTAYLDERKRG